MSYTLTHGLVLTTEECCACGVVFAMPQALNQQLMDSGKNFYCPVGHQQHYTHTTVMKLQAQLKRQKEDTDYYKKRTDEEHKEKEQYKHRLAAQKGQTTKLKKRIANGVCPCCQRSFQNLHRHMVHQHPEFAEPLND